MILVTMSPAAAALEESVSTLQFAARAMRVRIFAARNDESAAGGGGDASRARALNEVARLKQLLRSLAAQQQQQQHLPPPPPPRSPSSASSSASGGARARGRARGRRARGAPGDARRRRRRRDRGRARRAARRERAAAPGARARARARAARARDRADRARRRARRRRASGAARRRRRRRAQASECAARASRPAAAAAAGDISRAAVLEQQRAALERPQQLVAETEATQEALASARGAPRTAALAAVRRPPTARRPRRRRGRASGDAWDRVCIWRRRSARRRRSPCRRRSSCACPSTISATSSTRRARATQTRARRRPSATSPPLVDRPSRTAARAATARPCGAREHEQLSAARLPARAAAPVLTPRFVGDALREAVGRVARARTAMLAYFSMRRTPFARDRRARPRARAREPQHAADDSDGACAAATAALAPHRPALGDGKRQSRSCLIVLRCARRTASTRPRSRSTACRPRGPRREGEEEEAQEGRVESARRPGSLYLTTRAVEHRLVHATPPRGDGRATTAGRRDGRGLGRRCYCSRVRIGPSVRSRHAASGGNGA